MSALEALRGSDRESDRKRAALIDRALANGMISLCAYCGEPTPLCEHGKPSPPGAIDHLEPEPAAPPEPPEPPELVEWVQWRTGSGLSLFHVRKSSGGFLACGRKVPPFAAPAADSFPPVELKCAVCLGKVSS